MNKVNINQRQDHMVKCLKLAHPVCLSTNPDIQQVH